MANTKPFAQALAEMAAANPPQSGADFFQLMGPYLTPHQQEMATAILSQPTAATAGARGNQTIGLTGDVIANINSTPGGGSTGGTGGGTGGNTGGGAGTPAPGNAAGYVAQPTAPVTSAGKNASSGLPGQFQANGLPTGTTPGVNTSQPSSMLPSTGLRDPASINAAAGSSGYWGPGQTRPQQNIQTNGYDPVAAATAKKTGDSYAFSGPVSSMPNPNPGQPFVTTQAQSDTYTAAHPQSAQQQARQELNSDEGYRSLRLWDTSGAGNKGDINLPGGQPKANADPADRFDR